MFNKQIAIDLWRQGLSQSAIASHFGMTKGQIAGRFGRDRASFPKRSDAIERVERDIKDALYKPPEKKSSNALRKLFHVSKSASPVVSKAQAIAYDCSRLPGITMMELDEKRCCRWPLLDTVKGEIQYFCGEAKSGKNYCAAHLARSVRMVA